MKSKRIGLLMSFIMAVTILLCMMPGVCQKAYAEGNAAKIGDTEYATLGEAVAASQDGDTVTLLTDISLAQRVDVEKSITIDLSGRTVKPQSTALNGSAFNIKSGTVEIKNGKVDGTEVVEQPGKTSSSQVGIDDGISLVTVRSGAILNLTHDDIEMVVNSKNGCCVYAFAGGRINIGGGKYKNLTDEPYQYKDGFKGLTVNQANVETQLVNIRGGSFYGQDPRKGDDSGKCANFVDPEFASIFAGRNSDTGWATAYEIVSTRPVVIDLGEGHADIADALITSMDEEGYTATADGRLVTALFPVKSLHFESDSDFIGTVGDATLADAQSDLRFPFYEPLGEGRKHNGKLFGGLGQRSDGYKNWDEVLAELRDDEGVSPKLIDVDDPKLYALWGEPVTEVKLSVKPLVVGTEVMGEDDTTRYRQTPQPEVTLDTKHVYVDYYEDTDPKETAAYWFYTETGDIYGDILNGTVRAGESYVAAMDIQGEFGYLIDGDIKVILNEKELASDYYSVFNVNPLHIYAPIEAVSPVARIDDKYYHTLDDARLAAKKDGTDTVVLVDDVNEFLYVGKCNFTLDLNGHTLSNTKTDDKLTVWLAEESTLTIKDSSTAGTGKIVSGHGTAVRNSNNLTVESGTIEGKTYGVENTDASWDNYAATTINGGTIKGGTASVYNKLAADKFKINGGYFSDDAGNGESFTRPEGQKLFKDASDGYYKLADVVTLSFDAGGGSGEMDALELAKGQQYDLPVHEFTKPEDKCKFKAWEVVIGEGEAESKKPGDTITVNADTIVTATWEDHDWETPTYEWAEDKSTVTATRVCKNNAGQDCTETETASVTSEETKPATFEEEGERTYTASFNNTAAFETQKKTEIIPKLKPIKLTFIASTIDGENVASPYVVENIPEGSTLTELFGKGSITWEEIDQHFEEEIKKHFKTEVYSVKNIRVIPKKLKEYSTWREVVNAFDVTLNKPLTEDTTLYAAMNKYIDKISLSVEKPLCDTEVSNYMDMEDGHHYQQNAPKITVSESTHIPLKASDMNPKWIEGPSVNSPYVGTMEGGKSYFAMAEFDAADFGYVLDIDKLSEVTVENVDDKSVQYNTPYKITFAVTAEHDWDEGKVTKEPTIGSEGVKFFKCKHNEEHTKKEPIAKVDPSPIKDAIKSAQDAQKDVKTSEDGKDVPADTQWTTAAGKKALNDAIAEAEKVAADTDSTQDLVKAAADKLADALEDFNKAKKAGTKKDDEKYKDVDRITPSDATIVEKAKVDNKLAVNVKSISTAAKFTKKTMTIKWKKVKNATNYRVAYRKAGAKKWTMKWTKGKNKIVLKQMKKNGLYEFKLMAVRKSGSTWTKSKWSKVNYRFYANTKQTVKAGKGSVTVKMKKVRKASGYEVLTGSTAKVSKMKVKTFKGGKKLTRVVKGLKSGKKTFVRSRPYRNYKGKKYVGVLNQAKKVKVR